LPLSCKADVPMGAYDLRVIAKAAINGKEVTRLATVADIVRTGMNNLTFPPREMLTSIGVAVTDKPLFSLAVKFASAELLRGVATNVTVTSTRTAGFAEEIQIAPTVMPPNVTIAIKPIPKGANEVQFAVTPAANAAIGPLPLTFRGTAKSGGKDFAYYSVAASATIVVPIEVKAEPSPLMLKAGQKAKLMITLTRKGGYKGPVDVELKNLPANVTAPKVTIAADKTTAEVELTAAAAAAAGDKPDVQVTATATAAANQQATSPNVLLKVVK
jgi:hypothetical protein